MSLRRTRVGSIPDMLRLSSAVQRPGIDPRIWCSLAFALDESKLDKEYGDFIDVRLLPSELEVTCRVPQAYAGKDFGTNEGRIHKDDELVVVFPDGDPAQGGIVMARLWSASDTPPELVQNNDKDIVRQLEKDLAYRFKLTGEKGLIKGETESSLELELKTDKSTISVKNEADAKLESTKKYTVKGETVTLETGKVRLGEEGATEPLLLGDTYKTAEQQFLTQIQTVATQIQAAATQLSSAGALMSVPITGAVAAGPIIAAAGTTLISAATTLTTAASAFSSPYSTYLSTVSKTK